MGAISEGALAEVVEGMQLLSRADRHLSHLQARLKDCRVEIDSDSFKHVSFYLDQIHAKLSVIPLQVADAQAAKK